MKSVFISPNSGCAFAFFSTPAVPFATWKVKRKVNRRLIQITVGIKIKIIRDQFLPVRTMSKLFPCENFL